MCTAVAAGMGSGWEANIARLIDEANTTLSSSAYFRQHGEKTLPPHAGHRTTTRIASPFRSAAPVTFRGDRSASYRRDSGGWDASSLLIPPPRANAGRGDRFPVPPPPPTPASYSRQVATRVDTARIEGMEDRIKLDVQTNVNQRVSMSERAAEAVRKRVDGLAEEVANLGEIVRRSNASTAIALEQLLAGEQRSRSAVARLETWRADREEWCARTGDSLASLAEDSRALARRTHNQQKAIDEMVVAQEDLAASVKSGRKIGEAASASAMAPIREHFLKEIEAIRRRLLALEDNAAQKTTIGQAPDDSSPGQFRSIAGEQAAEKAEEVWKKVQTHLRDNVDKDAKETAAVAAAAAAARKQLEVHLAEVEQRVSTHDVALETLQKADRDTSRGEAPPTRDALKALEKRLADGLARIDAELRDVCSREGRHAATEAADQQVVKSCLNASAGKEDLKPILKRRLDATLLPPPPTTSRFSRLPLVDSPPRTPGKIEGLERSRSSADRAALAGDARPSVSAEKVESIAEAVQKLVSGAGAMDRRQATLENSLEEASETLNGHTLKLRCLEGLWRQAGSKDADEKGAEVAASCGSISSSGGGSGSGGEGEGDSGGNSEEISNSVSGFKPEAVSEEGGPLSSTAPALRAGLSGLLKRLGSNPLSSTQKESGAKEECGEGEPDLGGGSGADGNGNGNGGGRGTPGLAAGVKEPQGASVRLEVGHDTSVAEPAPPEALPGPRGAATASSDAAVSDQEDEGRLGEPWSESSQSATNGLRGKLPSAAGASPPEGRLGSSSAVASDGGDDDDERLAEHTAEEGEEPRGEPRKSSTPGLYRGEQGSREGGWGGSPEEMLIPAEEAKAAAQGAGPKKSQVESSRTTESTQDQQQKLAGREDNDRGPVLRENARADKCQEGNLEDLRHQSVSEITTTNAAVAAAAVQKVEKASVREETQGKGDLGAVVAAAAASTAEQRAARELEESGGSIEEESAHSRWSLPENRGIGGIGFAGGLHEQRAVWAGGQEDDDSVGTLEQALSSGESEGGGAGEDGQSPSRSRVESYDLQQEPEKDFMVPFSPDRTPNSATGSPGERSGGTSGFSAVTPERAGTPTAAPSPTRAVSFTPDVSPAAGSGDGGGGGDGVLPAEAASDTKQFCFSDDDESEAEIEGGDGDPEGPAGGCRTDSATRGAGSGGVKHRPDDKSDDLSNGRIGVGRSDVASRTLSPGEKRGVVSSACATPAPGTWDAPDFGFSSDDDLGIDLSASERSSDAFLEQSLSKSPESVKGTGE